MSSYFSSLIKCWHFLYCLLQRGPRLGFLGEPGLRDTVMCTEYLEVRTAQGYQNWETLAPLGDEPKTELIMKWGGKKGICILQSCPWEKFSQWLVLHFQAENPFLTWRRVWDWRMQLRHCWNVQLSWNYKEKWFGCVTRIGVAWSLGWNRMWWCLHGTAEGRGRDVQEDTTDWQWAECQGRF